MNADGGDGWAALLASLSANSAERSADLPATEGLPSLEDLATPGNVRSCTLLAALSRLGFLPDGAPKKLLDARFQEDGASGKHSSREAGALEVHIVGADFVEGTTAETVVQCFGLFLALCWQVIPTIRLCLIGFGVRPSLHGSRVVVGFKDVAKLPSDPLLALAIEALRSTVAEAEDCLLSAEVHHFVGSYEAFVADAELGRSASAEVAHRMVACFNAGIWGYDTWRPTVANLLELNSPVVVTAYSVNEGDADEEVIDAVVAEQRRAAGVDDGNAFADAGGAYVWTSEPNPWRSFAVHRVGSANGNPEELLHDSASWLCFHKRSLT